MSISLPMARKQGSLQTLVVNSLVIAGGEMPATTMAM